VCFEFPNIVLHGSFSMCGNDIAMFNRQFHEAFSGLVAQMESQGDNPEAKAMGEKLGEVYQVALKYSMKKNMG